MGLGAILGAAAGGLVGGVGQIIAQNSANESNERLAEKATEANIASAREQMAFQKHMSDTSFQRGVADMRRAGINPILAYSKGGASSPAGAAGSAVSASVDALPVGKALTNTVSSAIDAARLDNELELSNVEKLKRMEEARKTVADTVRVQQENEKFGAYRSGMKSKARLEKLQADMDRQMLDYDNAIRRIKAGFGAASSAMDVVNPLRRFRNMQRRNTDNSARAIGED